MHKILRYIAHCIMLNLSQLTHMEPLVPRSAAISYDQVAALCAQLAADGQRPTISRLAVALGNKGSTRLISAYLKRYIEDSGKQQLTPQRQRPGWSESLNQAADSFLAQLRELAFAEAAAAFDTSRAAWQAELEEMWQRVSEAELVREEAQALAEQRQQALAQQAALVNHLQSEREDLRSQLQQQDIMLTELQDQNARLTDNVLTLKDQLLQQEQAWQRRLADRLQEQQAAFVAAEEKARTIAKDEREYLMEQTYELRQAYARERSTLEQALKIAQTEAHVARQQEAQLRAELYLVAQQRETAVTALANADVQLQTQALQLKALQQQLQAPQEVAPTATPELPVRQ